METNTHTFEYQVVKYKQVEIDLDVLAIELLSNYSDIELEEIRETNDVDSVLTYFGDNTRFFLYKAGLPSVDEPDFDDLDFFFDEIYDKLHDIVEKHLNEKL